MDVINKEDLGVLEVPVTCEFCGEQSIMVVRQVQVGDFVQTISELNICCDDVRDRVGCRSGSEEYGPN
jgi:hypothetical protein